MGRALIRTLGSVRKPCSLNPHTLRMEAAHGHLWGRLERGDLETKPIQSGTDAEKRDNPYDIVQEHAPSSA